MPSPLQHPLVRQLLHFFVEGFDCLFLLFFGEGFVTTIRAGLVARWGTRDGSPDLDAVVYSMGFVEVFVELTALGGGIG